MSSVGGRGPGRGLGPAVRLLGAWASASTAALVTALVLLPILYLVIRALSGGVGEAGELLLRSSTFWLAARSVALAGVVTVCCLALALPLAWLTALTDVPGRRVWAVTAVAPLAVPCYVGALVYLAALEPTGPVARAASALGIEGVAPVKGFVGAVVVLALFIYPLAYLPIRAAMVRLDPRLEEASRAMGRGRARTLVGVVIPQLRPAIAAGALLVALYTLGEFGAVSLLQFDSFTRVIHTQYTSTFDYSAAAVSSLVLVAITVPVLWMFTFAERRGDRRRSSTAVTRRATVRLGAWRWPAAALCASVACAGVLVPVAVLLYWMIRARAWVHGGRWIQDAAGAVGASFGVSLAAAVVTVAAAVPVAAVAVRGRSRWAALPTQVAYLGFGLPGIVVALGLAFFALRAGPLYQSWAMLIGAYIVLMVAQAVGVARATLLRVPPHLTEAARALGRGPAGAFWTVTVPVIRPGLLAAGALVFLATMKELPATLLLKPIGTETLATLLWFSGTEGLFGRAALPALLLIGVSSLAVWAIVRREGLLS
jgi:iron(III) transport system permease protein